MTSYELWLAEQEKAVAAWQRRGSLWARLGKWWYVTVLGRALS